MHRRGSKPDLRSVVAFELGEELAVGGIDPVELLQEIDVEKGSSELAIGDPLQSDGFFFLH
jgi:hypothetical protein